MPKETLKDIKNSDHWEWNWADGKQNRKSFYSVLFHDLKKFFEP